MTALVISCWPGFAHVDAGRLADAEVILFAPLDGQQVAAVEEDRGVAA